MSTTKRFAYRAGIQGRNINDLDIEERKRRLEMAPLVTLFSDCYIHGGTAQPLRRVLY
ncbi:hypothetical protein [Myxococcus qinghaiensis]|uniref:hypothetical protein n=1 Tax=Myxococcus qinghaiensis TaxID=2906758 RepID=UPI0020A7E068|nr:hypothetical protein [Myxococcus qinghaiensis]MCP3166851.1 hypothetical protein [Myxococcus qinghaiensis]